MMLNIKLLSASAVGAAGALKLWTEPGGWGIVLNVIGALLLSWIIFVTVLYLTASRLRREPQAGRKQLKPAKIPARVPVQYDPNGFTRISR